MNRVAWSALAMLLWFLNMLDATWTLEAVANGAFEANPLMRWLILDHPGIFIVYKLGIIPACILALGMFAHRFNIAKAGITVGLCLYVPLTAWHAFLRISNGWF